MKDITKSVSISSNVATVLKNLGYLERGKDCGTGHIWHFKKIGDLPLNLPILTEEVATALENYRNQITLTKPKSVQQLSIAPADSSTDRIFLKEEKEISLENDTKENWVDPKSKEGREILAGLLEPGFTGQYENEANKIDHPPTLTEIHQMLSEIKGTVDTIYNYYFGSAHG